MNKISRILFVIAGIAMPILIGLLHTKVHFDDLVRPEIMALLQVNGEIAGTVQPLWNTWGIVSFMMGLSFIVIGLLCISHVSNRSRPSVWAYGALIIYYLGVIYVGIEFQSAPQHYGGIVGLAFILGSGSLAYLTRRSKYD